MRDSMRLALLPAATALACMAAAEQPAADSPAGGSKIELSHNREHFTTTIRIRATDGYVAQADVLRGFARARGYDDAELQGVLPDARLKIDSLGFRLMRVGLNRILGPAIHYRVAPPEVEGGEPVLVVKLDRVALLSSQRRFKRWLRERLAPEREDRQQYGLLLDDDWEQVAAEKNLVVVLHGYSSRPEAVEGLLELARKEGFPCGSFRYPNDQSIAESGQLLSGELKQLAEDHPDRGVSLVTHSMGGLVAREAIENAELDPGNVRRLIMVAPPSHGSALAYFSFGLDLWEHLRDRSRIQQVGLFYASVEDGLSEASVDLTPGSVFLQQLNARDRNPRVRYSIFLGTKAPLSQNELDALGRQITKQGQKNRWVRFLGATANQWLADLEEVVAGKGDGVVAVKRGRLPGVEDTLVLDFGHMTVTDTSGRGDAKRLHETVLKRLR